MMQTTSTTDQTRKDGRSEMLGKIGSNTTNNDRCSMIGSVNYYQVNTSINVVDWVARKRYICHVPKEQSINLILFQMIRYAARSATNLV